MTNQPEKLCTDNNERKTLTIHLADYSKHFLKSFTHIKIKKENEEIEFESKVFYEALEEILMRSSKCDHS